MNRPPAGTVRERLSLPCPRRTVTGPSRCRITRCVPAAAKDSRYGRSRWTDRYCLSHPRPALVRSGVTHGCRRMPLVSSSPSSLVTRPSLMPNRCSLTVRSSLSLVGLKEGLLHPTSGTFAVGCRHNRHQPQPLVLERPLVELALHEGQLRLRGGLRGEGADRGEDVLAADPVLLPNDHPHVRCPSLGGDEQGSERNAPRSRRWAVCPSHRAGRRDAPHQPWMPCSRAAMTVSPMNRSPARARVHTDWEMPK